MKQVMKIYILYEKFWEVFNFGQNFVRNSKRSKFLVLNVSAYVVVKSLKIVCGCIPILLHQLKGK